MNQAALLRPLLFRISVKTPLTSLDGLDLLASAVHHARWAGAHHLRQSGRGTLARQFRKALSQQKLTSCF